MPTFSKGYKAYPPVLLQTGENIYEVEPELAHEHTAMRKKISSARAWPVAGDWSVKEFCKFPMLARELRNLIWEFAVTALPPRVINICMTQGELRCNVANPKIFHACSDSRQQALLTYRPLVLNGIFSRTYINFVIDWVFFDSHMPLVKSFGLDAEYSIFQQNCRKMILRSDILGVDAKKSLERFVSLEKIALVGQDNSCGSGCNFISRSPDVTGIEDWQLNILIKNVKAMANGVSSIKSTCVVDIHRDGSPRIMSESEKERARMTRQKERELAAPVKADEVVASILQHQIDMRQAGPEEAAIEAKAAAEAPDEDIFDEDEFGLVYGIEHGVFSDDFFGYC